LTTSPDELEEELEELMADLPNEPEEIEEELKLHMQLYEALKDSRRKKDRLQAQYHLGHVAGIVKTMTALGYADWLNQIVGDLQSESDEQWMQTEGGMAMSAADQWMGRKVFQMGRGRPPYPGQG
jgi:hypothetical protein